MFKFAANTENIRNILFLFAGIFFSIYGMSDLMQTKSWSNHEKNKLVMCHEGQERNIPFKVIGVLQTQNDINFTHFKDEITLIYPDIQPEDFYKHFELNTFIRSNGKIPTIDFSKRIIGFVLYNIPKNVLSVDVKQVYEFTDKPNCFDCEDTCDEVLVGVKMNIETGVDENLFPATVVLIQIDPPKEWDRKNISFWPYSFISDKLWVDLLKGVYN